MTPNEYQEECRRTWTNKPVSPITQRRNHALLGLTMELGELADLHVKPQHYGATVAAQHEVIDEAGDVLWFLTMLLEEWGATLEEAMAANVAKLRARHPDGFSSAKYTNGDGPPSGALVDVPEQGIKPHWYDENGKALFDGRG